MSSSDREAHARGLDRVRRCVEAATAGYVNEVVRSGDHLLDGHRSISAWGQAACNWSAGEAARLARLGRAMHRLPKFGAAATAGQIGVAHMHAVAGLVANPRIEHAGLADGTHRHPTRLRRARRRLRGCRRQQHRHRRRCRSRHQLRTPTTTVHRTPPTSRAARRTTMPVARMQPTIQPLPSRPHPPLQH